MKGFVIKANAHAYSISALCRCLGIARSTYYYECAGRSDERDLEEAIQIACDENRRVYGQRKIKRVLLRRGLIVSKRKIGRIMKRRGLVSAYTRKKCHVNAIKVNEAPVANLLDRYFSDRLPGACVVSDLTYVRVGSQWAYICILLDLGAREIIGYSAGAHKTAELVRDAFACVKGNLLEIQLSHTDTCSNPKNNLVSHIP